jgi:hypothetical protein
MSAVSRPGRLWGYPPGCVKPPCRDAREVADIDRGCSSRQGESRTTSSTVDRFHRKVRVTESGCWEWTGTLRKSNGYALFSAGGRQHLAHRWAYETFVGPIPDGHQVDHQCHDPATCSDVPCAHRRCVNPGHLAALTPRDNTLRSGALTAANVSKTHCPHGHEYTEANTIWKRSSRRRPRRLCRACWNSYQNKARRDRNAARKVAI